VGSEFGINDHGTVVGSYVDINTGTHGFVSMGGILTTLDDPIAVGVTAATGINDAGDIVGYYIDAAGVTHGFLDVGGVFTMIDNPNALGVTRVFGINDLGELVGEYVDANGVHGFVATAAIPEPNTLALLGISLAGTMVLLRRRK
jgi:probable HAF family extracellular repeat protein